MYFLLEMRIFHCYVTLPEGRSFKFSNVNDQTLNNKKRKALSWFGC